MKLRIPVLFLSLFLGVDANARTNPKNADEYFKQATTKLFENNLPQAQALYSKAYRKYKLVSNHRKMNECMVAMAIIEYTKGRFNKSIKILRAAKKNHLKWCKDDPDGLQTINESIMLANMEKRRLSTMSDINHPK